MIWIGDSAGRCARSDEDDEMDRKETTRGLGSGLSKVVSVLN